MAGEPKAATSAKLSVAYITVGSLVVVWTVVYYIYLHRIEASDLAYLWSYGFFFSGLVLVGIGLAIGPLGRAARQAEVTPPPVPPPVAVQPMPPGVPPMVNGTGAPVPPGAVPATPPTAPPVPPAGTPLPSSR